MSKELKTNITTDDNQLYGSLPRVASMLFDRPLMIATHSLDAILAYLGPRMNFDAPKVEGNYSTRQRNYRVAPGGVAMIPIVGELVHRGGFMDAMSGLTSYQSIRHSFDAALGDPEVSKIVLEIDSPGGDANHVMDLAEHIRQSSSIKPVYAVIDGMGYSAAYALASAAQKIYVTQTSGVGSIGVVAVHVDQSSYNEKEGFKVTHVYAGDKKVNLSPHQELSDEAYNDMKAMVDHHYDIFVSTVSRNRGLSTKAVKDTQAGLFIGKSGVKAGLADKVASASDALREISNAKVKKGGMSMSIENTTDADTVQQTDQQDVQASENVNQKEDLQMSNEATEPQATESGEVIDFEARLKEAVGEATVNASKAAVERAKEIVSMCNIAGIPSMSAELLESDKSVDECRKAVLEAKAQADMAHSVNGNFSSTSEKQNYGWGDIVAETNSIINK